jgi:hypothetical protein
MLNLNSKESVSLIKKFKANSKSQNQAARLVDIDSLTLDSATWVLETVLNFDFDYRSQNSYYSYFTNLTGTISINDDALKVNSMDLENYYFTITTSISSLTNDSIKVRMIDVESYIYDPGTSTAIFVLKVQLLNSYQPITCHLPSYYISGTPSCILICPSSYYSSHFGCAPSGNFFDALDLLNKALICYPDAWGGNCGPWFYSISQGNYQPDFQVTFSNPYPNALYYSGLQSSTSFFCPPICLTTTQLNNYYYGAIALGTSVAPAGYSITSISYSPNGSAVNYPGTNWQYYWEATIYTGKATCITELPD